MIAVVTGASRPLRVKVLVSPMPEAHASVSAMAGKMNSGTRASRKTRSRMPFCIMARMRAGTLDRTSWRSSLNQALGRAVSVVIATPV